MKRKELFLLLLLTLGALLVHGYHPGVEDAEIYMPGVKKSLNPVLYPFGAEFFLSHAHLTFFDKLIASSVRITRLPFDVVVFGWHLLSIFLLLLACWKLSGKFFSEPAARWCGVALIAALLTIPVAGTSLYILDQYLTPRSIAAFTVPFAVLCALEGKYVRTGLWIAFTATMHPLMSVFGLSFMLLLLWMKEAPPTAALAALLPLGISFDRPSAAYHEAVSTRSYFFILQWEWYEWLGIFAPLVLLWWFWGIARRHEMPVLARVCRCLIHFGLIFFAATLVLTIPARFEGLALLQPMRSLHLLYTLFFVIAGGLAGRWVLKDRAWRWVLLFVPLCAGMWFVQRELFPASPHLELPGLAPRNEWVQAFLWIRQNTPEDAIFALDPYHMTLPGEDQHGFRVIAERSMLADAVKDSGAATMFPNLRIAEHWREQVSAQREWKTFQAADFRKLKTQYGVTWVVLERRGVEGLSCPYRNASLLVCRVD